MKFVKWLLVSSLVLAALPPAVAHAEDAPTTETRARQYYTEGTGHFQAGRYSEAGAAFAAGFELTHKPGFLWNMAECARLAGHRERALDLYHRYVKEAPDGSQRGDAEKHIRELEPAPKPAPAPVVVAPVTTTRANDVFKPLPADDTTSTPVTKRWWFWTGAAAIVAGAVVTGVVLATSGGSSSSGPTGPTVDWRSR